MNLRADQCPVCGMQVTAGEHATEYHKMTINFCTAQCRENFQAYPAFYSSGMARQRGEVIKRRHLRLSQPLSVEHSQGLMQHIQEMMGVKEVSIKGHRLTVRYDLLQMKLTQLEDALASQDATLDNGWWQRLQRAWVYNTETTEMDNLAAAQGACCSRPPPRVGR